MTLSWLGCSSSSSVPLRKHSQMLGYRLKVTQIPSVLPKQMQFHFCGSCHIHGYVCGVIPHSCRCFQNWWHKSHSSGSGKVEIDLIELQAVREPRTKTYGSNDGSELSQTQWEACLMISCSLQGEMGEDQRGRVCVAWSCSTGDSATPHPFSLRILRWVNCPVASCSFTGLLAPFSLCSIRFLQQYPKARRSCVEWGWLTKLLEQRSDAI